MKLRAGLAVVPIFWNVCSLAAISSSSILPYFGEVITMMSHELETFYLYMNVIADERGWRRRYTRVDGDRYPP